MSITVERTADKDIHGLKSAEQAWLITGTAEENEALTALYQTAPASIARMTGLHYRDDVSVEADTIDSEHPDRCIWRGRVTYRHEAWSWTSKAPKPLSSLSIRGSTRGGNLHIRTSLATVAAYGTDATPGDNDQFVGVKPNADGGVEIEGAEIATRGFDFQVLAVYPTGSYPSLDDLYDLSGMVNNAAFSITDSDTGQTINAAAGELLYLGADFGDRREDGGLELLHHFSLSRNATGLVIGDITGIAKAGWHYLWARYQNEVNATLKLMVPTARAAYVERMYEAGSFSVLGFDELG